MAKLTSKQRNKLPDAAFALPKQRKYPIKKLVKGKLVPDKTHAANAKSRATQMQDDGQLSKASENQIKSKANKVLGKSNSKKGRMKTQFKSTDEMRDYYKKRGMY